MTRRRADRWVATSLVRSNWLSELAALRRAHRTNWILREVPATNRPPGGLLSVSAGTSLQGAARNPRANAGCHSIPIGQEPRSGASWHLVSCHSTRISGPLIPSLSFPPPLKKVLPAQVARSARRRSTSRLHERARPRMAPRYREAFVTVSSRRSFSVSELHLKDFDRCDALT